MPKLILASGSKARQEMLRGCGLAFDVVPADIDEQALIAEHKGSVGEKAELLACEKAKHVAHSNKDAYVIGSDQILEMDGQIFSKARDTEQALDKLKALRGQTHSLISAVAVVQNEEILFQYSEAAILKMHDFDNEFLAHYADQAEDVLTNCVGAYALEAHGSWLFEKIEGDYFTILGMPLLALLSYLKEQGFHP